MRCVTPEVSPSVDASPPPQQQHSLCGQHPVSRSSRGRLCKCDLGWINTSLCGFQHQELRQFCLQAAIIYWLEKTVRSLVGKTKVPAGMESLEKHSKNICSVGVNEGSRESYFDVLLGVPSCLKCSPKRFCSHMIPGPYLVTPLEFLILWRKYQMLGQVTSFTFLVQMICPSCSQTQNDSFLVLGCTVGIGFFSDNLSVLLLDRNTILLLIRCKIKLTAETFHFRIPLDLNTKINNDVF